MIHPRGMFTTGNLIIANLAMTGTARDLEQVDKILADDIHARKAEIRASALDVPDRMLDNLRARREAVRAALGVRMGR